MISLMCEVKTESNKLNETNSQTQISVWWLQEGRGWGEYEEGKDGQLYSDERRLGGKHTCNKHIMYYRIVPLKLM